MNKQNLPQGCVSVFIAFIFLAGCATTSKPGSELTQLKTAVSPAYSVALPQPDMIVAVSPVRQTMQIGGSIPPCWERISAIQDAHNASEIHSVLSGYDCGAF